LWEVPRRRAYRADPRQPQSQRRSRHVTDQPEGRLLAWLAQGMFGATENGEHKTAPTGGCPHTETAA